MVCGNRPLVLHTLIDDSLESTSSLCSYLTLHNFSSICESSFKYKFKTDGSFLRCSTRDERARLLAVAGKMIVH